MISKSRLAVAYLSEVCSFLCCVSHTQAVLVYSSCSYFFLDLHFVCRLSSIVYRLSIHILIPSPTHIRSYYSVVVSLLSPISSCDHLCFCPFDLSVASLFWWDPPSLSLGVHIVYSLVGFYVVGCYLGLSGVSRRARSFSSNLHSFYLCGPISPPYRKLKNGFSLRRWRYAPLPTPASFYVHLNSTLYPLRANALPSPLRPLSTYTSIQTSFARHAGRQSFVIFFHLLFPTPPPNLHPSSLWSNASNPTKHTVFVRFWLFFFFFFFIHSHFFCPGSICSSSVVMYFCTYT